MTEKAAQPWNLPKPRIGLGSEAAEFGEEMPAMIMVGHIKNGVVVLDTPAALPEGTAVRVEVVSTAPVASPEESLSKRTGGQYAGQIWMAPDFDEWPVDFQEAFGMNP